jgi:hypothetical protein
VHASFFCAKSGFKLFMDLGGMGGVRGGGGGVQTPSP